MGRRAVPPIQGIKFEIELMFQQTSICTLSLSDTNPTPTLLDPDLLDPNGNCNY